jgi:uncharacterized membrane protein
MAISCPQCSASMPDIAAFCPRCGRRMIDAPVEVGATGFLKANVAGALAYITAIPAVIFLQIMPFKRNQFVRFHSWQSIFLLIAGVLVGLGVKFIFSILALIPRFGYLFACLAVLLVSLAWVMVWLVAVIKALNREMFKLPIIGHFAEKA